MHLEDGLQRFVVQLRANGRSAHAIEQYRRHVALLAAWCGTKGREPSLEQLDHEAVASFLASPQALQRADGRRKQTSTVNALRASLRGLFRYLHQAGHTQADLARLIRPAMGGRSKPKALLVEQQHRVVGALTAATGTFEDRRDRALFLTMLKTGSRLNAVLQAEVEDLDLVAGEFQLRRCKAGQKHLAFLPQYCGRRPAPLPQGPLRTALGRRSLQIVYGLCRLGRRLIPDACGHARCRRVEVPIARAPWSEVPAGIADIEPREA
jgi:site-specific recombinase XerD